MHRPQHKYYLNWEIRMVNRVIWQFLGILELIIVFIVACKLTCKVAKFSLNMNVITNMFDEQSGVFKDTSLD